VPGAYVDHRSSFNQERSLDQHLMKIEVAYVTQRQSSQNLQRNYSAQSDRTLQYKSSVQSNHTLLHTSSIQSDRGLHNISSVQSNRTSQHKTSMHSDRSAHRRSSVQLPAVDELGKRSPPIRIDSKSRYRGQKSFVHYPETRISAKEARPAISHLVNPVRDGFAKITPFRRLSLGDMSPGFGSIGKMFE
jgi:hypothetical protein